MQAGRRIEPCQPADRMQCCNPMFGVPNPPALQAFTDHFYSTFDSARANLAGLYQDQSMLTFEGQKFQGTQAVSPRSATTSQAAHSCFPPCAPPAPWNAMPPARRRDLHAAPTASTFSHLQPSWGEEE